MFQRTKNEPQEVAVDLSDFVVRDLYHFDEDAIQSQCDHIITIIPDEEVLLHRIVMHHSVARHLRLRGIYTGNVVQPGKRKSGTCEIFYAEVPNWTPQGIVFSPSRPLRIEVRNENEKMWLLAGSVIVFKRSKKLGAPTAEEKDD
jgi:hypothetical protein